MKERRWFFALLAAAFALRVVYCWLFPQWGPGGSIPDPNEYETFAESFLYHGQMINKSGLVSASREPGYPLLLAGLYWFTGPSYRAAQALNCVLGTLTLGLIFALGAAVFNRRVAWLAAGIAAFYPQFLYYTATLERETLLVFLIALSLWLVVRACREPSAPRLAAAGAVAALSPLTNSALLPAGAMLAPGIWLLSRRAGRDGNRPAALYLAAFLALYALWPLRNYAVFNRFILGINGGGAHIYIGIVVPNDVAGTPAEAEFIQKDPVTRAAALLDETQRDKLFYAAALRWIVEHPLGYARVMRDSFLKLWRLYPYQRSYAYRYGVIKWVSLLSDGWIIPLGLLGLLLCGRRRYPEADLFNLVLFAVSFTYMIFWSIIRYRLPMMPITILYCAFALDAIAGWMGLRLLLPHHQKR